MSDVTQVLESINRGESQAAERLLPLVYEELRKVAAQKMTLNVSGQTLQPTALVHEAWLRLGGDTQPMWQNRAHFFAAAAEAMRHILIDKARRRRRIRHGGDQARVDFADIEIALPERDDRLLAIDGALDKLSAEDPLKANVVKLRFFVGFSQRETANALGISERTVDRYWNYAKTWLLDSIRKDG